MEGHGLSDWYESNVFNVVSHFVIKKYNKLFDLFAILIIIITLLKHHR